MLAVEEDLIERVSTGISLMSGKIQGNFVFSSRLSAICSRKRTEVQSVGAKFPAIDIREIGTDIRETLFSDQGSVCSIISDTKPDMGGGKVRFLIMRHGRAIAAAIIRRAKIGAALYPTDPAIANKPPISLTNHVGVTSLPK